MLYFPRYKTKLDQKQISSSKPLTNIQTEATILVVDDEPALLQLTSKILHKQGYQVYSAQNAKQALEILESNIIDLLVFDVIMPGMDGYELATIVQKKYPEIKIQMVSGFSDDRHLKSIDESLYENLIYKPYGSQDLLYRIGELLNN